MIKMGLIGCGWIVEKAHIPAFSQIKNVCVTSVFDTNVMRLQAIKEKFNIPNIYSDFNQFIHSEIDAVVIATPNHTHSEYTNIALNNNKHVLCEKPVALTAVDYQKSLDIASKNSKILLPAFVNRFRTDIRKLNDLLYNYDLGKLHKINAAWMRKSGVPRPGSWITDKRYSGGGVLTDLGSHVFDICLTAVNTKQIKKVTLNNLEYKTDPEMASWCKADYNKELLVNVETAATGLVEFMDGVKINFNLSWDCNTKGDYTSFEFIFEKGRVFLNTLFGFGTNPLFDSIKLGIDSSNIKEKYEMAIKSHQAERAFEYQAIHFIDVISGNNTYYSDSNNGLCVTKLIECLYASA